ncbi:UNVERIFIED_CONTAM: hypothetical protein PYX00_008963 [Menopon gallinae]|uniref:PHD-type domain-containing protein n=1 Tax=Menopon gallinae TaxID=328185 RepID=A0AAW2H9M1_9NEOP
MKRNRDDSGRKCPQYYKIGDKVEAVKLNIGAWFNADIIDIYPTARCECFEQCQCLFKILFESDEDKVEIAERTLDEIRQVTYSSLDWDSLKPGMKVVINYNIENPDKWGYWYDYIIDFVTKRDCITYVKGTLLVGYNGVTDKIPVEINSDKVLDVLEIRPHATVTEKEMEDYETGVKPEYCKSCKNKPKAKCRKCCCCKCGMKKDFQLTVLCDECADWYHIYCVNPPLTRIPDDDDW